jgi:aminopeptidase N
LVEVPYLGMEHQSNVAYGNKFKNGYLGRDLSGTGWGLNWDFIIIHESGHEWFGNNITSKDIADMWIHEGFTNYTETLFTQWLNGKTAANEYNVGSRKNILNDIPVIGPYGVNKSGSSDMYYKASAMIHSIRNAMNNDEHFRRMLRELNKQFYHATITTKDVEKVINQFTGFSVDKIFNQYLRGINIPVFEYYLSADSSKLYYRYTNSVEGFNMPLVIPVRDSSIKISPKNEAWQSFNLGNGMANKIGIKELDQFFYVTVYEKKELAIKAY